MFSSSDFTPFVFEGKGEIEVRGKKISYHTVSEDNVIYDNEGKAIASIFSFSYFRNGVEDTASRPVIFGFNGGPGTSSCMVHTGFLGPKRLKYKEDVDDMTGLPPYETVDNPECLLDIADIEKLTINAAKSAFCHHEKKLSLIYDTIKRRYAQIRAGL